MDRVAQWFEGFKPPANLFKLKKNSNRRKKKRPSSAGDRFQLGNGIDYDLYETGEDHNLIFYGSEEGDDGSSSSSRPVSTSGSTAEQHLQEQYDFLDVLNSIRNNETR